MDLGQFCGSKIPANVTSLSNEVRVVFQSNASSIIPFRGFALRFTTNQDGNLKKHIHKKRKKKSNLKCDKLHVRLL